MNILPASVREWSLAILFSNLTMVLFVVITPLRTLPLPYLVSGVFIMVSAVGLVLSQVPNAFKVPDVWWRQRQVMEISKQSLPPLPTINKHTFLYYALILEEHAETGEALYSALKHICDPRAPKAATVDLAQTMLTFSKSLGMMSRQLRRMVAESGAPHYQLPRHLATPLLDGHVDTMVTLAGFGNATGLPALEAYEEVQASNLSKANPDTGQIDVDASGKWIKGKNYRQPNLDKALDHQEVEFNQRCAEEEYYANT